MKKYSKINSLLRISIFSFVFTLFSAQRTIATVYYVDTNSPLGGQGTTLAKSGPRRAWKTLAQVNGAKLKPGDTVLFKRGCLWRGTLVIPSSGTQENPITFGAYGDGNSPVISGSELVAKWYGPNQNGEYWTTGSFKTHILLKDGKRIERKQKGPLLKESWSYKSRKIYLKLAPDEKLTDHTLEIGVRNHALVITGKHYVVVQNLIFVGGNGRNYPESSAGCVTIGEASRFITIKNCTIKEGFFSGVCIGGGSNHIAVEQSDIFGHSGVGIDVRGFGTKDITIKGNKIHDIAGLLSDDCAGGDKGGITITLHHGGRSRCLIEYNEVYDNSMGGDSKECRSDYGVSIFEAGDNIVRYNRIYNNYGGGIYVIAIDANARNNKIYYNLVWENGKSRYANQNNMAIRTGGNKNSDVSGTIIANNTIYNNRLKKGTGAIHIGGYSGKISIINNISAMNDPDGYELFYSSRKNNAKISNNCYFRNKGKVIYYAGRNYGIHKLRGNLLGYYTYDVPGDSTSIFEDPRFVDTRNQNFRLSSGSPCINAGKSIGLEHDIFGIRIRCLPVIGATEYIAQSEISNKH